MLLVDTESKSTFLYQIFESNDSVFIQRTCMPCSNDLLPATLNALSEDVRQSWARYIRSIQKESPDYLGLHAGDMYKNIDCYAVHNSKIRGNKPSVHP